VLTVAGFAVLAGCGGGGSEVADAERALAAALAGDLGVEEDDVLVTCPPDADLSAGAELTCEVSVEGAGAQAVPVAMGDGGRATLAAAVIPTDAAEDHLASTLGLDGAMVSCGDVALLVGTVGETFRCEVADGDDPARAYELEVTSVTGEVRHRLLPVGVAAG
jgi:hypothetical protein